MGNVTSVDESCGNYNVTVSVLSFDFLNNGSIVLQDQPFYPINTFSFFNAFILFCIQGFVFKPLSRLLKQHFPRYKATFYPGDKSFKNAAIARMQEESSHAASKPFIEISERSLNVAEQKPMPRWALFLQNNVMCFCDPLFAFYHTLFHTAHFVYLFVDVLHCVDGDGDGAKIACPFREHPWILYQAFYLRFILSGCPTFFSLLLFSCFVHEGGVLVGFNIMVFRRFKWHGLCLFANALLLLPAVVTHSVPMLIVYSPFIIALCLCLAGVVMFSTWLMHYLWENVRWCSNFCDGRALLLVMQVIMKVMCFSILVQFNQNSALSCF
jgi:hypothetical protein